MAEKLNQDGLLLRGVLTRELERQHEQSGIHDLVVGRTEDQSQLRVEGKVDVDQLAIAVMRHGLGQAYRALVGYDPFEDDPTQTVDEVAELLAGVAQEAKQAEHETAVAKLAQAEGLIRELDQHEGAEGWSADLRERLEGYIFVTAAEGKANG